MGMRTSIRRALLPCAATFVMLSLRCGGGSSTASDIGTLGGTGSSGGGSGGIGSGTQHFGVGGTSASDASSSADGWTAPDVGTTVEAGSPGQVDITFTIHADQAAHPISQYVYGVNNGSVAAAHHAPIVRSGGNRLTAYNWENNASNAGSDYQFENDDSLCSNAACRPNNNAPGAYLKFVVDQASAAGAAALLTVPIVDYVSADKSPGGDVRSGGSNYWIRSRG